MTKNGRLQHLLLRPYGKRNFIRLGMWDDKPNWLWNHELLRKQVQASIGSFK